MLTTYPADGGKPSAPSIDVLVEAARLPLPPDVKQRAPRYGKLGACVACKQAILAHLDAAGGWLGCPNATDDTVFVLVPVSEAGTTTPSSRTRQFRIARYIATLPLGKTIDDLDLSDQRKRTLQAVVATGKTGTRANEVIQRSGLSHGAVQQALAWLRAHTLVEAHEDDTGNHGTT